MAAVGIETAARLGYKYVEPCLSTGYDLLALAGYYHMVSMEEDPLEVKGWLDELGLKPSAVSAHSPLMRPEVGIVSPARQLKKVDLPEPDGPMMEMNSPR